MSEYRTHSFNKEWHDKVEEFIKDNDLAFDSPKYFIKFCVNKYMDEHEAVDAAGSQLEELKSKIKDLEEKE